MKDIVRSEVYFPVSTQNMMRFVSYLFNRALVYGTILTYITAVSYICKLWSLPDPANSFVVRKLLNAVKRTAHAPDSRLPMTPTILLRLRSTLFWSFKDEFTRILVWCMYMTAFHGFLRIGEMAPPTLSLRDKVIQVSDVYITKNINGTESLEICLKFCKGNVSKQPFYISIQKHPDSRLCAIEAFKCYIPLRGNAPGPLFVSKNGIPMLRGAFASILKHNLMMSGFSTDLYKGHSFRIGAATTASASGLDDAEIMKMGRWKSSAIKRYIRMPKQSIRCSLV